MTSPRSRHRGATGWTSTRWSRIVPIEGTGPEVTADGAALYRFVIAHGETGETVASNYQDNAPQQLLMAKENEVITDAVVGKPIGSRVVLAMPVTDLLGDEGAPRSGSSRTTTS